MMLNRYQNVDFIYEPFLWGEPTWNKIYEKIGEAFDVMTSLSIDGIFTHQNLPLFITSPYRYKKNPYLRMLFHVKDKNKHVLLKIIRGCGRFSLFQAICPGCKFIFILRNPFDVINSAIIRFSFLGADFHKDDFPRFAGQVNEIYDLALQPDHMQNQVEKEVLYWYYMNRYTLERFHGLKQNRPLVICYEAFIENKKYYVEQIGRFIGIDYSENYTGLLQEKIGPDTNNINLKLDEFEIIKPYLNKYLQLLYQYRIPNSINPGQILEKYKDKLIKKREVDQYFKKTPLRLKNDMMMLLKKKRTL